MTDSPFEVSCRSVNEHSEEEKRIVVYYGRNKASAPVESEVLRTSVPLTGPHSRLTSSR